MALVFKDTPQIYGDRRRLGDPGETGDHWLAKFPAHAKPISQMPETGGPFNVGIWKVYERDYDGKTKPAVWGFRHRDQIWRRVPERNHYGELRYVTRGTITNAVAFSS